MLSRLFLDIQSATPLPIAPNTRIAVRYRIIPAYYKAAGVQCLTDRRTHDRDKTCDIKKSAELFRAHHSVQKRCDHDLQHRIHKDQSTHGVQGVYCNTFFLFLFFQSYSCPSVSHRFPCDPDISHNGFLCIYAFRRRAPEFHLRSLL